MGMFDSIGDALSGAVETVAPYGGIIGGALGGPLGAMAGSMIGGALGGAGNTQQSRQAFGNMLQGGLGLAGQAQQFAVSRQAIQDAQNRAMQGGQTAADMAQFRPVGITNTFGTSNYQFDPNTGRLTGAGYSLSPQLQGAQNTLMGGLGQNLQDTANIQAMGRQYMAKSPQEQAQQYMANQQALLAPSREQQSANLMNQLSNTGREGLKVAQGGDLGMANPEYQALANARAMQDLQLAANATQAGQQQYQFGQGLLSSAYQPYNAGLASAGATEALGQQPFTLGNQLGTAASQAGANAGNLYNQGAQRAAAFGLSPELQTSNTANILSGLSSPYSQLGSGLASLFNGGVVPSWTTGSDVFPASTFGGWGNDYSGFGDSSFLTSIGL